MFTPQVPGMTSSIVPSPRRSPADIEEKGFAPDVASQPPGPGMKVPSPFPNAWLRQILSETVAASNFPSPSKSPSTADPLARIQASELGLLFHAPTIWKDTGGGAWAKTELISPLNNKRSNVVIWDVVKGTSAWRMCEELAGRSRLRFTR